ncbi:MAG: hypothetical protein ACLFP0_03155, partial [Rhodosalinus sp.]
LRSRACRAGGTCKSEDWVLDNFGRAPFARTSMLRRAENVAARIGIPTARRCIIVDGQGEA